MSRPLIPVLLLVSGGWSLWAESPFLDVFPASAVVPGLAYAGQFSHEIAYTPSGSTWAPGLDEREVFFAGLRHSQDPGNSWEIRIGKGGQLYSIRGPFGESQAPQTQPDAHWVDQIFQLVGVNLAKNLDTPGHAYFIHQAGDYLDDPILKGTFYAPMLASGFDDSARTASALNWGQQARIPSVYSADLLYYERIKDLGSGVVEITYVVYNFGAEAIDYLNTPWGGVRKSVLPVTLISDPSGSFHEAGARWDEQKFVNLRDTGGWIAWTQNAGDSSSPALALVVGTDRGPQASYQFAPARLRYGTGPPENDFEVAEADPYVKLSPGMALFFRVYLVVGPLGQVRTLANTLSAEAAVGEIQFTEENADLVPLYPKAAAGQTVLTTAGAPGATPAFYTFAQPVMHSRPLFVVRSTETGQQRLTTDACELCTMVPFGTGEVVSKPYDGKVEYVGFLGYVLPADRVTGAGAVYSDLLDLIPDRSFFPANARNRALRAVTRGLHQELKRDESLAGVDGAR